MYTQRNGELMIIMNTATSVIRKQTDLASCLTTAQIKANNRSEMIIEIADS